MRIHTASRTRDLPLTEPCQLRLDRVPIRRRFTHHFLQFIREHFERPRLRAVARPLQERVHFRADLLRGRFPRRLFCAVLLALRRRGERHVIAPEHGGKEGFQTEIIFLQDRIELVIVASRAAETQPQKHLARGVSDIRQNDLPLAAHIALVPLVNRVPQIRRGYENIRVPRIDFVPGDLLRQKLVVRFVAVKTLDHPVPIPPRSGTIRVLVVAIALCVPDQIQPMLRPALAVTRTCEERVHEPFVGVRRLVFDETRRLLRLRRQTVQIEVDPPHQLGAIRLGRWVHTGLALFL